jgi:hypothetical protein
MNGALLLEPKKPPNRDEDDDEEALDADLLFKGGGLYFMRS